MSSKGSGIQVSLCGERLLRRPEMGMLRQSGRTDFMLTSNQCKSNASSLSINPERIVLGGGSAGGNIVSYD